MYYRSINKEKYARKMAARRLGAASSAAYYSGKLYPSGHGSIGRVPPSKEKRDLAAELELNKYEQATARIVGYPGAPHHQVVLEEWQYFRTKKERIPTPPIPPPDDLLRCIGSAACQAPATPKGLTDNRFYDRETVLGGGDGHEPLDNEVEDSSLIGSSSLPSPHKPRGSHGLTRYGAVLIREYCYLASKDNRKYAMYTLTCPYSSTEEVHLYSRNIQEIARRYFQEIGREYARRGEEFDYAAVYEIQAKRMKRLKQVALHIHYLAPATYAAKNSSYVLNFDEMKKIYKRVCERVLDCEATFSNSVDGAIVRKNAGAYMSKYMSKSTDDIASAEEILPVFYPSKWYSVSRNAVARIKSGTLVLYKEVAFHVMRYVKAIKDDTDSCEYYREIYIPQGPQGSMCIGVAFKLSRNVAEDLTEFVRTSNLNQIS